MNNEKLKELLQAKKRDHKIVITDEAINKVPRIEYKEIAEEQYDILQLLLQETMTISQRDNNSDEVAITYSLDANIDNDDRNMVYGVSLGDEHSVDPLEDVTSYHIINGTAECVVVILHNHPSLSKLSLQDIQYLLMYHSLKMIVAVTNLGSVFYLVKTNKYDYHRAMQLYKQAYKMFDEANNLADYQKATDYFLNNCSTVGLIHEDR